MDARGSPLPKCNGHNQFYENNNHIRSVNRNMRCKSGCNLHYRIKNKFQMRIVYVKYQFIPLELKNLCDFLHLRPLVSNFENGCENDSSISEITKNSSYPEW